MRPTFTSPCCRAHLPVVQRQVGAKLRGIDELHKRCWAYILLLLRITLYIVRARELVRLFTQELGKIFMDASLSGLLLAPSSTVPLIGSEIRVLVDSSN